MEDTRIVVRFIQSSRFVSRRLYSLLTGKNISALHESRMSNVDKKKYISVELYAREKGSSGSLVKIGESDLFRV